MRNCRPLCFIGTIICFTGAAFSKTQPSASSAEPTFARDVAPIIYKNCTPCHRPGEAAPFVLQTYTDAKKRAKQIAIVTQARLMPPWKADSHGEFLSERRLTAAEMETLKQWAEADAPEGDPNTLPPLPKFPEGWQLGAPDLTVSPAEPYSVYAEGRDIYRCFVIPTNFEADRFVSAIDFRPGNRAVVHHVLAYVDTEGRARKLDAKDAAPGYSTGGGIGFPPSGMLGGWAPGAPPYRLPAVTGIRLPKGADIVLEVHYHPTGKPETDRSQAALYFNHSAKIERELRLFPLMNFWFRIPPGARNHEVRADLTVPADATVYSVFPHMHLLGRQMTINATLPDHTKKRLIHVPDWDFNWQGFYAYKEPMRLPKGTRIELAARYDNSTSNPLNPHNPPKAVGWGEQTTDEMCLAFLGFTLDAERMTEPKR